MAGEQAPVVITVATDYTPQVANLEHSLAEHGWEHRVQMLGRPWEGFRTKMAGYLEGLEQLESERLAVLCDSSDVLRS